MQYIFHIKQLPLHIMKYLIINKRTKLKSLDKALTIFEYVMNNGESAVTPKKVAEFSGINISTCTKIMRQLTERGYFDQFSRRSGYLPGPALYSLTDRECCYSRLAKFATVPLMKLGRKIHSLVNISVMRNGVKFILNHYSPDPGNQLPITTSYSTDHYITGTGRLLLSVASKSTIDNVVSRLGMPNNQWNGIATNEELLQELKKIREQAFVEFINPKYPATLIMAGLIRVESYPASAIGFGIRLNTDKDEASRALKDTVKEVEAALKDSNGFLSQVF